MNYLCQFSVFSVLVSHVVPHCSMSDLTSTQFSSQFHSNISNGKPYRVFELNRYLMLNIFIETSCTLDNRWCLFCAHEIFLGVRTIPGITDCRPSCSVFLNIVHWKTLQWRCYLYSPSSNSNIYITCMCIVPKHMERSVSPHLKIYSSFPANRRLQWWYLYGSSGLVRVICTHSCAQYF